jgi:DNA-binding transcriptional LysR family regulator
LVQANIELRHLRYILAVAEERNFTRAAARCHVSQSALSKQILEVEKDLGTKLFDRQFKPKSTQLTQAGIIFQREARRAVEYSLRAVSQVQALVTAEERPLELGVSALLDIPLYLGLIGTAQRSVKESSTQIRTAYTRNLVVLVLRGVLDAAIVDLPVKTSGLRVVTLGAEALNVAFPDSHPFTAKSRRSIRLAELVSAPVIMLSSKADPSRPIVEEALRASGPTTFKIADAGNIVELLDHVVFGQRIGIVRSSTQRLLRKGVLQKPIVDGPALGHALIFRLNDHSRRLHSFTDAVVAFYRNRTLESH